jgi:hypothetical protein
MKNKWVIVIGISLVFNCAFAGCGGYFSKSITVKNININGLNGNHIGMYVFEELPLYGHYTPENTAINYHQFGKRRYSHFVLRTPSSNIHMIEMGVRKKFLLEWNGTGDYYVAICVFDEFDSFPIKDMYILTDKNNLPVKASIYWANTVLDFRKFRKGNEFYHSELAEFYINDLIYEYDPSSEKDLYYENDLLIDAVYDGNAFLLDKEKKKKMLNCFNASELRLLRNMIFAKYNYRFSSKDLRDYFSKFVWYTCTESDVRKNMTAADWQNISVIQNMEKKYSGYVDSSNLGNSFSVKGQTGRDQLSGDYISYRRVVKKLKVDGEIIAKINNKIKYNLDLREIAKGEITDGQFNLELGEISPDLLDDWNFVKADLFQCSDSEIKAVSPYFFISGTYTDLYGVGQPVPVREKKYLDRGVPEYGKGYYDRHYYLYSDRNYFIQGAAEGEPGNTKFLTDIYQNAKRKMVYSIFLKKGWNKIKYSITYNGKYIIHKTESSPENGFYEIISTR